ncbi:hypothetical protein E2562_002097 [Oryza meyeriana var. granulata]|uniref:Uncharacterized protein n=1 Tax=Oryza meyeriana var. granulata TaxID=110450 RepID=A0A6G1EDM1_9ORYZ|nr:hypothetical protein E2562_002097 [Oryza meyeriana var. granulata]
MAEKGWRGSSGRSERERRKAFGLGIHGGSAMVGRAGDEKIGITFIQSAGGCILSNVISTFLISYGFASSSFVLSNVDSTFVSYGFTTSKFVAIVGRSSVEVEEAYHHETLRKKLGHREERRSVSGSIWK